MFSLYCHISLHPSASPGGSVHCQVVLAARTPLVQSMVLEFKPPSLCCQANIAVKQRHPLLSLSYGFTLLAFRLSSLQTAFKLTSQICIWEVCLTLSGAGSTISPSCSWAAPKPRGSSISDISTSPGCSTADHSANTWNPARSLALPRKWALQRDKACKDPLRCYTA